MKSKFSKQSCRTKALSSGVAIVLALGLSGCTLNPPVKEATPPEMAAPTPNAMLPLTYYQMLSRMTQAELGRERMVLAALPHGANTQVRMAMLLGHPRAQQDISRAIALLENVLKSTDPTSIGLQGLARLMADNYIERQKIEAHLDRQGQQLKENQRKLVELQEKIDGLADIERTLPQRPRAARPAPTGATR